MLCQKLFQIYRHKTVSRECYVFPSVLHFSEVHERLQGSFLPSDYRPVHSMRRIQPLMPVAYAERFDVCPMPDPKRELQGAYILSEN